MTVSPTRYYSFGRPAIGGSFNIWGEELNDFLDDIDAAISAQQTLDISKINKNYVINPCFLVNQRYGFTLTTLSDSMKFSDMWDYKMAGAGVIKYEPVKNLLGSEGYNQPYTMYGGRFSVNTKEDPMSINSYYYIENKIEGYHYSELKNRANLTLSFWVKCNKIGTYSVSFSNNALNRSYVAEYSVTTTKWDKKTITFIPDTTGTWETGNLIGLRIRFALGVGSNYMLTAGSWANTDKIGSWNQTNLLNTTSSRFILSQVKLEADSVSTIFEQRPINYELFLCERYFEKSHEFEYPVDAANTLCSYAEFSGINGTTPFLASVMSRVSKRATATVISYKYTGTSYGIYADFFNTYSVSCNYAGQNIGTIANSSTAGLTRNIYYFPYIIDAEL